MLVRTSMKENAVSKLYLSISIKAHIYLLVYESNEIADNCKCYKLDLVACFGIEEIPRKFPNNVRKS